MFLDGCDCDKIMCIKYVDVKICTYTLEVKKLLMNIDFFEGVSGDKICLEDVSDYELILVILMKIRALKYIEFTKLSKLIARFFREHLHRIFITKNLSPLSRTEKLISPPPPPGEGEINAALMVDAVKHFSANVLQNTSPVKNNDQYLILVCIFSTMRTQCNENEA